MDLSVLTTVFQDFLPMFKAVALAVGPQGLIIFGIMFTANFALKFFKKFAMDRIDYYKNYYGFYDEGITEGGYDSPEGIEISDGVYQIGDTDSEDFFDDWEDGEHDE